MKTTISNKSIRAVIQNKGAELISLKSLKTEREYIWEGNPEFWGKHSPILFPIVGTLKNNCFYHNKKQYKLSRHGFARDMDFELKERTETEVVFWLQSNSETKKIYPFDFELTITYTLKDSELSVRYDIKSLNDESMYYSIGGHPAFGLSDEFESYSLQFQPEENLIRFKLENDLISNDSNVIHLVNNQLPLSYSIFEDDALIFKKLTSNKITLLENQKPILDFKFNNFPNFGIWTKINSPFICLEPWAGYSDTIDSNGELSQKEGIQVLYGRSSKSHDFTIEIL